ncbi:O-antigen ligase family protein [Novosphingobium sp. MBES04]|uniref:O-antigen ligase family protein n=1 Tax=Novosphingobium sp. MBES04 TaxID=1206458 RepID=UPI00057EC516|nr:O-antigen ligase family protein [Novosphingobium sp. MBES04]
MIALAVFFGGGGSGAGVSNAVVQIWALLLLAVNGDKVEQFFRTAPVSLRVLVVCTLLLPALQLVPLPPAIWQALPGRDPAQQTFELLGSGDVWQPISLWPMRTLLALLGLIVPFTALVLASDLQGTRRLWPFGAIVLMGGVNCLLGAIQLATGNVQGNLYGGRVDPNQVYGTFANHNTAGIFLVFALVALLPFLDGLGKWRWARSGIWLYGLVAIFALACVLTQSRSAVGVMAFAVVALAIWIVRRRGGGSLRVGRSALIIGGGVILAGSLIAAGVASTHRGSAVVQRYLAWESGDARATLWPEAYDSAKRFMPVGAGVGAFSAVFDLEESLETLDHGKAGRAHNELLEVAIESGLVGMLLLAAWGIVLVVGGVRCGFLGSSGTRFGAALILTCASLQSLVDYPLRSQAGLGVAGVMVALLLTGSRRGRQHVSGH